MDDRVTPGHDGRFGPDRFQVMPTALPRIAVIGTGGTISSLGAGSLDVLD